MLRLALILDQVPISVAGGRGMKKEGACGDHTGGSVRDESSGLEECVPLKL